MCGYGKITRISYSFGIFLAFNFDKYPIRYWI